MSTVQPITAPIALTGALKVTTSENGRICLDLTDEEFGGLTAMGDSLEEALAGLIEVVTSHAISEEARAWSEDTTNAPDVQAACEAVFPVWALQRVMLERAQQIDRGYIAEHDDVHDEGEMVDAALCYAVASKLEGPKPDCFVPQKWPWLPEDFRPKLDAAENVITAIALLIGELIRLQRVEARKEQA